MSWHDRFGLVVVGIFFGGILVTYCFQWWAMRQLSKKQREIIKSDTQRSANLWLPLLPLIRLLPLRRLAAGNHAKIIFGLFDVAILGGAIVACIYGLRRQRDLRFPNSFLRRETWCFIAYAVLMAGFFAFDISSLPRPSNDW